MNNEGEESSQEGVELSHGKWVQDIVVHADISQIHVLHVHNYNFNKKKAFLQLLAVAITHSW